MKRLFVFMLLLVCVRANWALAGYDDLREAIESYQPPASHYNQVQHSQDTRVVEDSSEFEVVKAQLASKKAEWQASLKTPEPDNEFYQPGAGLKKRMDPVSRDQNAAAAQLAQGFSLETLEALVWMRAPAIKAAQKRFLGNVEAFSQVATLDEILRQYTAFTSSLKPGVGPMKGKDSVQKKFPFPGILALKGQIVDQRVRASRENLEIARRDAVTAARQTYWRLSYVHTAQQILRKMLGLLGHLESVATTRYESGRTSFQDVAKIRIQRETLKQRLISLRERQRNMETKILELANLPPTSPVGPPKKQRGSGMRYDLEALYEIALDRRQELRRLRADIGRLERMVELVETKILPGFSLSFSTYENTPILKVGSGAEMDNFPVTTQASIGAGLPKTPWYGTNDAYLRQVRLKHQALKAELQRAEAETGTLVRTAWFEFDKAQREARLFRDTVITLSETALETSNSGYEAGKVTFADVFDSYIIWLEARLSLAGANSAIGIAKAGLEKAVGASLK